MTDNQDAYKAGGQAYRDGASPFANPHAPAPPGNLMHARLWRAGWQAAKRRNTAQLNKRQAGDIDNTVQGVYGTDMNKPAPGFNAILIPWDGQPELVRVSHAESLGYLQGKVGGYIEAAYSADMETTFFCNEEGKLTSDWPERINHRATALWWALNEAMRQQDVLVGTVVITGGADANGDTLSAPKRITDILGITK